MVLTGSKDLADDLAQAACARALEKADQFKPDTHLDRWVFRIAQRLWLNNRRAEAVRRGNGVVSAVDFELIDPGPGPEANIFASEVLSKVSALPEAQREAVMLVYVEGFAYKEAAEILGIPIGTVMSRLAAARTKLAKDLSQEESRAG